MENGHVTMDNSQGVFGFKWEVRWDETSRKQRALWLLEFWGFAGEWKKIERNDIVGVGFFD